MPDLPRLLGFVAGAALDATLPDPPNSLHPVAAIGPCARFIEGFAPHEPDSRRRFGWLLAVFAPLLVALLVKRTQSATNPPARIVTDAGLLALASSRHTLFSRVADVADALERGQLDEARRMLGYHLVSRDTTSLDASEVAGAAIESLAENLSDGVIAPLTYHAIGGARWRGPTAPRTRSMRSGAIATSATSTSVAASRASMTRGTSCQPGSPPPQSALPRSPKTLEPRPYAAGGAIERSHPAPTPDIRCPQSPAPWESNSGSAASTSSAAADARQPSATCVPRFASAVSPPRSPPVCSPWHRSSEVAPNE